MRVYLHKIIYWLAWPIITLILHHTTRTRVILRYKNQVLLVQNWLSGGVWDLPGGGVHRGEAVSYAAVREVHEELGITLQTSDLKRFSTATINRGLFWFEAVYFEARTTKKFKFSLQKHELSNAQWVTRRDLPKYSLSQGVDTALQRCFKRP